MAAHHITISGLRKVYSPRAVPSLRSAVRSLMGGRSVDLELRDAKVALRDVSLRFDEGDRIGIVGVNGAGKSTLMQLIAGVATPTSGTLEVRGRVHAVLTVGVGLREEMTGRENLRLEAEVQGTPRDRLDALVEEMAAFTELGEFIDRPVRTYSSGMKSRLSFSSLVFINPEILILDETLSAGDYQFAEKASRAVRDLCDRGSIVIIVSHSREAVLELCNRCIWMHDGEVRGDGDPAEITEAYRRFLRGKEETDLEAQFEDAVSHEPASALIRSAGVVIADRVRRVCICQVGDPLCVEVELVEPSMLGTCTITLRLVRWDGLLVGESTLQADPDAVTEDGVVQVRFDDVQWRPGLYNVIVVVARTNEEREERALLVKVISDRPSLGGEPVLRGAVHALAVPESDLHA